MDTLIQILDTKLFVVGSSEITPRVLAILIASVLALVFATRRLERWGTARLIARGDTEPGAVKALFQILRYLALVIGLIAIVEAVGIDLSEFVVVIGTLGIGVGLALQPLLTNFVGGIVLLIERPLKVGDRIELGTLQGAVLSIGMRATYVRTNDHIDVIVPNATLVGSNIVNWTHEERRVRIEVPVGVAYATDPVVVRDTLIAVARAQAGVLADPAPDVLLDEFGESALCFVLRVWTATYLDRPRVLRSELNFSILAALRARGIDIPFPQQDVRVTQLPAPATAA